MAGVAVVLVCLAEVPAAAAPEERFEFRLRASGSDLFGFATTDEQFFAVFGEGACRPRRSQTAIRVDVQPLDPAGLGALPAGLLVTGQAYRLRARYVPSGRPVEAFAADVTVGLAYRRSELTAPGARTLLYSLDGKGWTRIQTGDAQDPDRATGRLPAPGYVLLAAPSGASAPDETAGDRLRRLLPFVLLAVILVALLVARRRRRAGTADQPTPAGGPPPPPARRRQLQADGSPSRTTPSRPGGGAGWPECGRGDDNGGRLLTAHTGAENPATERG